MTTPARDGRDGPFGDWLRKHPDLDSYTIKLYSNDVDQVFCKYKTHIDSCGTRRVKLMLEAEIKCFGKVPDPEQTEVLFFRHQLLLRKGDIGVDLFSSLLRKQVTVWHFGQYVLQINDGERPDKCNSLAWGIFDSQGKLRWNRITERQLINILSFEYRPDRYVRLSLRRHHKTQELVYTETRGLLFPLEKRVLARS